MPSALSFNPRPSLLSSLTYTVREHEGHCNSIVKTNTISKEKNRIQSMVVVVIKKVKKIEEIIFLLSYLFNPSFLWFLPSFKA